MSNELINRSLLLEELNDISLNISGSANAMALVVMDETKKRIAKIIEEQPAAFDLDKIVKKIEYAVEPIDQCTHRFCQEIAVEDCDRYANCESCMSEHIIEIIKSSEKKGMEI